MSLHVLDAGDGGGGMSKRSAVSLLGVVLPDVKPRNDRKTQEKH